MSDNWRRSLSLFFCCCCAQRTFVLPVPDEMAPPDLSGVHFQLTSNVMTAWIDSHPLKSWLGWIVTANYLFDSSTRLHFISEFNMVLNQTFRWQIHLNITGECSLTQSQMPQWRQSISSVLLPPAWLLLRHRRACTRVSLSIDHHFLHTNRCLWHLKINGDVTIGRHFAF